jgi:hypothetical protein
VGRTLRNAVSAALLSCVLVSGVAGAAGINLSWNDCGLAGTDCLTFTCDSNTGAEFSFVGSFVPPAGITAPQYFEASVRVISDAQPGNMPDWWRHGSSTECRGIAALKVGPSLGATCVDVTAGAAFPPQIAYFPDAPSPGQASLVIVVLLPDKAPALDSNAEHYAFRINFDRTKTTGPGSCAGCNVGTQIVLDFVSIFQNPEVSGDPVILTDYITTNKIGWQNPAYCFWTPVKRSTWGSVRSMYR